MAMCALFRPAQVPQSQACSPRLARLRSAVSRIAFLLSAPGHTARQFANTLFSRHIENTYQYHVKALYIYKGQPDLLQLRFHNSFKNNRKHLRNCLTCILVNQLIELSEVATCQEVVSKARIVIR